MKIWKYESYNKINCIGNTLLEMSLFIIYKYYININKNTCTRNISVYLTTVAPYVGTHKWRLVYKQMMNDRLFLSHKQLIGIKRHFY